MRGDTELDPVFRALSDPTRRVILDFLKETPGMTVGEVCDHFEVTRFAVMKHLRVLEDAELVVSRREGKFKRLYLNVMPLQLLQDRWMSSYSKLWAAGLSDLKYTLEGKEPAVKEIKQVYQLYIRTTRDALWKAITAPEETQKYFYALRVSSEFRMGDSIEYLGMSPTGETICAVSGEILEIVPGQKLVHTFLGMKDGIQDTYHTRVTYEIEEVGDMCKLTLIHDDFPARDETYGSTSEGWPMVLNSLKSLLETGKALEFPMPTKAE